MPELLSAYPPEAWAALLATGALIGLLAGLLGIGGGVVAVPVLLEVFALAGMAEPAAVRLAVGTGQASILVASITAIVAHGRAGTIDVALVRAWLPGLMAGALLGLTFAPFAPARSITLVLAAVAAALAVKMVAGDRLAVAARPPRGPLSHLIPVAVGGLASAGGIGAGTLSTPTLSLFSFPVRNAFGAGALFNLVISLPATIVFLLIDREAPGRPADAVGHVALLCVAALSLPALFVAPLAARWSTRAPVLWLQRLFALCLAVIAARLLFR